MRTGTFAKLAGAVLSLAACSTPGADPLTPAGMTGSEQTAPRVGGVTFQNPTNVSPSRGEGGVTFQTPTNVPTGAYTGSERGSNSPLRLRRNPSQMPGVAPLEQ